MSGILLEKCKALSGERACSVYPMEINYNVRTYEIYEYIFICLHM